MTKQKRSVKDLFFDPANANRGTERGRAMLEHSLRQYGAGRSVLADKNGVLIAGNKTAQVAGELGLSIREIETDGTELVVVRRTDLDLATDTAAQALALADNRVSQVDIAFDPAVLKSLQAKEGLDLTPFWSAEELQKVTTEKQQLVFLGDAQADDNGVSSPSLKPAAEQDRIPLSIVLNTYEARRWREYKESIDERDDKQALLSLLEAI